MKSYEMLGLAIPKTSKVVDLKKQKERNGSKGSALEWLEAFPGMKPTYKYIYICTHMIIYTQYGVIIYHIVYI